MIPSPISSALGTLQAHKVPYLLMGGQACVLYGGAEFSRDLDLVVTTRANALEQLQTALADLQAEPIAVPPLRRDLLDRGHAAQFRCQRADVAQLRIDLLARPPRIADVEGLWSRRVRLPLPGDAPIDVVALPDLVATKKTQRDKDWATIGQLLDADLVRHGQTPTSEQVRFWLREARDAEQVIMLASTFPDPAAEEMASRPLLARALEGDRDGVVRAGARADPGEGGRSGILGTLRG